MGRRVSVDELADVINEGLQEYASLTSEKVKSAVRKSAKTVKERQARRRPGTRHPAHRACGRSGHRDAGRPDRESCTR